MKNILLAVSAALALVAASTWAAEPGPPEAKRQGTVEYVSGEIGLEQADVASAANYNLGATFASQGGEYLGEVRVVVTNARKETVLDIETEGPRLLARLPPDRYHVVASFAGKTVTREATVGGPERTEVEFLWPIDASGARLEPSHGQVPDTALQDR